MRVALLSPLVAGAIVALAMPTPATAQQPDSYIMESRHNASEHGGTGQFPGPVDNIRSIGLHWSASFHDQTNHTTRTLDISVDDDSHTMTIVESGGGGGAPVQTWKGQFRKSGNIYKMSGTCVMENGNPVHDKYDISANLVLPD